MRILINGKDIKGWTLEKIITEIDEQPFSFRNFYTLFEGVIMEGFTYKWPNLLVQVLTKDNQHITLYINLEKLQNEKSINQR